LPRRKDEGLKIEVGNLLFRPMMASALFPSFPLQSQDRQAICLNYGNIIEQGKYDLSPILREEMWESGRMTIKNEKKQPQVISHDPFRGKITSCTGAEGKWNWRID